MDEEYIKLLQQQAAAGSEMAIFELQQLGYDARIPDADASYLTFETLFPYAKTLGLGLKGLRAFNAARFTGTPGSMYRGIGTEGLKDLQKSGVLRPKQNISPIKVGAFDVAKDFNKIQKGVYASPSIETAKRYGQGVIAEIPQGAAKFMQRYKGTNWSQKTQDLLPIDNINVFKQNFFGKYKPVKFNYGGDMKKIKKYENGGDPSIRDYGMLPEVTVTAGQENPFGSGMNYGLESGASYPLYTPATGAITPLDDIVGGFLPGVGETMDVSYMADAIARGAYDEAGLGALAFLIPAMSFPQLKRMYSKYKNSRPHDRELLDTFRTQIKKKEAKFKKKGNKMTDAEYEEFSANPFADEMGEMGSSDRLNYPGMYRESSPSFGNKFDAYTDPISEKNIIQMRKDEGVGLFDFDKGRPGKIEYPSFGSDKDYFLKQGQKRSKAWTDWTQDMLLQGKNPFYNEGRFVYRPKPDPNLLKKYGGNHIKKINKYPHGGPHTDIVGPGVPQYQEGDAPIDFGMMDEITLTDKNPHLVDYPGLTILGQELIKPKRGRRAETSFWTGDRRVWDEQGNELSYEDANIGRPRTGIAPDPSGMSIKQLLKTVQNLPKFLKYIKDIGPDKARQLGDKLQDVYYGLTNIKGPKATKEVSQRIDQVKDLMDKVDSSSRMIKEGQQSLVPNINKFFIESAKKAERTGDPLMGIPNPDDRLRGIRDFSDLVKGRTQTVKDIESQIGSAKKLFFNPNVSTPTALEAAKKITSGEMDLMRAQNQLKKITKDYDDFILGKTGPVADENLDMIFKGTLPRTDANMFKPDFNFTPGEGAILDTYMNPFKLNKYGGKNMKNKSMDVDYEAEGGEVVIGDISVNKAYNGGTAKQYKGANMYMLQGPSHAKGGIGIKMNTPSDNSMNYMSMGGSDSASYVFTDRLKDGKETYADKAAKFGNRLDEVTTMAMGGDSYDRATAKLMKPRIMSEVSDLFNKQEQFKKKNNIDQEPRQAAFGLAALGLGKLAAGAGLSKGLAAAQFLPGLFNIGKSVFGKTPELEYDPIVPQMQEYQDFNPLIKSYLGQQDRSLAGLRASLEGSGASGSQLRAGFQAGLSGSQSNAANFLSQVGQMQSQSDRQTDQFNIGQQTTADQGNMQAQMMNDQFMAQNDPTKAFSQGLSQILGTATGMSREGFQRGLIGNLFGMGNNTTLPTAASNFNVLDNFQGLGTYSTPPTLNNSNILNGLRGLQLFG